MSLIIPMHLKLKGHFHLTAINADTGEVRELADFDNLIVNQGLNYIATGGPAAGLNSVIYYACSVGTGTTPAAPGDTTMQNFLAGTYTTIATTSSNAGSPSFATTTSTTYQFATGVAAGNLTEIGIVAPGVGQTQTTVPTAATPLFSHSLIMIGGSPGTITILSNEILNVVYTITMYPIITTSTGSFSLNTDGTITTVNYSLLSAGVTSSNYYLPSGTSKINAGYNPASDTAYPSGATLGTVTGTPTGGTAVALTGATVVVASYTVNSYFLSYTVSVPIGGANTSSASIGAMVLFNGGGNVTKLQVAFSPAIAKSTSQTFSIVFNISWSN
jgi:hypothetical protein